MKHIPRISSSDKTVVMSGNNQSAEEAGVNGDNTGRKDYLDEEKGKNHSSPYEKEQTSQALYWSVLHHKNLHENIHEDVPTTGKPSKGILANDGQRRKDEKLPKDIPKMVIHEGEPFLAEISSRSALTEYGSTTESPPVSPPNVPPETSSSSGASRGWGKLREAVHSKEVLIRHNVRGHDEEKKRWSDLDSSDYELTLLDCAILHAALLTIGVIAYSFVFEKWTVIDAIYFR